MQWSFAQIRTTWKKKISERAIAIPKENWWYIVARHNNTTITFFKLQVKSFFLSGCKDLPCPLFLAQTAHAM